MRRLMWRAAIFAALGLPVAAPAQDITLTARNGGLSLDGTLMGFDGEFYRLETKYGPLTVDGASVICDGPACPDLIAPLATLRILGAAEPGNGILPRLLSSFAEAHGYRIETAPFDGGFTARIANAEGTPIAEVSFAPAPPAQALEALTDGAAELVVSATAVPELTSRVLALDALLPIVSPDNPLPRISTPDLARALSGEVENWAELGGPDMPLVLHALEPEASLQAALAARLGRAIPASVTHPDLATLAEAVARDPYGLAVTGQPAQGVARALPLIDSCGFALQPSPLAVKAEDYPLSLPLYLVTPRRRLPLFARELLDFLATLPAQEAIAAAGYVDRAPTRVALTADGARLINAIRTAGEGGSLVDLNRLAAGMAGTDRLSLTFRFEEGTDSLDAHSRENLTDLAALLEIGRFRGQQIVLAGFSDGTGAAEANLALSKQRAEAVAAALAEVLTDTPEGKPAARIEAYGETLPMACDTTVAGRQMNRRVEVWLRPLVKGNLAP